ncbi:Pds5 protein [Saccharomycopsis crataegensis]|uniref:Pds5 protein n=1 Tax=Saccharomycopsis crataegensis TaxID=43959 RepID=A0AAV5QQB9_9ASCO|nr:Pds5 protein [Saccharomycopsis crataegensis]
MSSDRESEAGTVQFQFSDSIVPSVKDPIATKVLVKRLSKLAKQLAALEESSVDLRSLTSITKDIVSPKLLRHNDYGVQSYTALCVLEILWIHAPNAPFTASQLTEIFKLFTKIVKTLALPPDSSGYFPQNLAAMTKLAETSSIILMTDLPKADQLTETFFKVCYEEVGKSKHCSNRLIAVISDILSGIVSETEVLSQNILKMILSKFLSNAHKTTNGSNNIGAIMINNPGFEFTLAICENNIERMGRQVAKFLSEELYENSSYGINNDNDDSDEENLDFKRRSQHLDAISMKNLVKLHRLIEEIWKYVPQLLSSVMGLLDAELVADNDKIRILSTETIGRILEYQPSKLNFLTTHHETWINWSKKILDASPLVRCKWVQTATKVLNSRFDMVTEISNGIVKALIDTDEKVRLTAVKSVKENTSQTIFSGKFNHNLTIMNTLGQLARERNLEIRNDSIYLLAEFYDHKFSDLIEEEAEKEDIEEEVTQEEGNNNTSTTTTTSSLCKLIGWIPDHLINLVYINSKEINATLDTILVDKIFTLENSATQRVKRFLYIVSKLGQKAKIALWAINQRQVQLSGGISTYLKLVERYHSPEYSASRSSIESKLETAINWIISGLPDAFNAFNVLVRFAQLDNKRMVNLVRLCVAPENAIETIKNSFKELFNKLGDNKVIARLDRDGDDEIDLDESVWENSFHVTTREMVDTWKLLLYRSAVIYYNKSNIGPLMLRAKEGDKTAVDVAQQVASTVPKVFESHIDELVKLVIEASPVDEFGDKENTNAFATPLSSPTKPLRKKKATVKADTLVNILKAIYYFFARYPKYFPKENSQFAEALANICSTGTPFEAKYSIKLLALFETEAYASGNLLSANYYTESILQSILPLDSHNPQFASHLSIISELFLLKPSVIETDTSEITNYLIKEVLLNNELISDDEKKRDNNEENNGDENNDTKNNDTNNNKDLWITDEDLEAGKFNACYAKILALRIFVNRLTALDRDNKDIDNTTLANMVLKLLVSCIGNGGELVGESITPTPAPVQSRLRLAAGLMLLKLSKVPTYNRMLKPQTISHLVLLVQDENPKVRAEFAGSLQNYLNHETISQRYLPLIFFMAHEPDLALRKTAKTWIRSSFARESTKGGEEILFEKSLVRLLHMVAHHQEFIDVINEAYQNNTSGETSTDSNEALFKAFGFAVKYVIFYLDSVATKDNISLLYYFCQRIKQYRDALISDLHYDLVPRPTHIDNMYRVADVASLAVNLVASKRSWVIQTFPGKLQLPKDLFSPMKSPQETHDVVGQTYIPTTISRSLETFIKSELGYTQVGNSKKRSLGAGTTTKTTGAGAVAAPLARKKFKPTKTLSKKKKVKQEQLRPTRRSSRVIQKINYADSSSESGEDDKEDDILSSRSESDE